MQTVEEVENTIWGGIAFLSLVNPNIESQNGGEKLFVNKAVLEYAANNPMPCNIKEMADRVLKRKRHEDDLLESEEAKQDAVDKILGED